VFAVLPAQIVIQSVRYGSVHVVFYVAGEQSATSAAAFVARANSASDPLNRQLAVISASLDATTPAPGAGAGPSDAGRSSELSTQTWYILIGCVAAAVIICIVVIVVVVVLRRGGKAGDPSEEEGQPPKKAAPGAGKPKRSAYEVDDDDDEDEGYDLPMPRKAQPRPWRGGTTAPQVDAFQQQPRRAQPAQPPRESYYDVSSEDWTDVEDDDGIDDGGDSYDYPPARRQYGTPAARQGESRFALRTPPVSQPQQQPPPQQQQRGNPRGGPQWMDRYAGY
jgi:hypothetical protein